MASLPHRASATSQPSCQDGERSSSDDGKRQQQFLRHRQQPTSAPLPSASMLLSPVSFQHSQLRSKKEFFPSILLPVRRPLAPQSKNQEATLSRKPTPAPPAAAHHHDGDTSATSPSTSFSPSRSSSPLTLALFSSHLPSRLTVCIRQLKSELDALRSNLEAYTCYLRRVEFQVERNVVPSLVPYLSYLTTSPPPVFNLSHHPSPQMVRCQYHNFLSPYLDTAHTPRLSLMIMMMYSHCLPGARHGPPAHIRIIIH